MSDSRNLARDIASDHFLSLHKIARQNYVTDFLNYIDTTEINQGYHHVLNELFYDAVVSGNLELVSRKAISRAIRSRADEDAEEVDDDLESIGRTEDNLVREIDQYDPRCVLETMRAIFAYLESKK